MCNPRSISRMWRVAIAGATGLLGLVVCLRAEQSRGQSAIGRELAIPRQLEDDEEFRLALPDLVEYGRQLFAANWTDQEGGGRPLMKGTGKELTDSSKPLIGARAFNRISAPD